MKEYNAGLEWNKFDWLSISAYLLLKIGWPKDFGQHKHDLDLSFRANTKQCTMNGRDQCTIYISWIYQGFITFIKDISRIYPWYQNYIFFTTVRKKGCPNPKPLQRKCKANKKDQQIIYQVSKNYPGYHLTTRICSTSCQLYFPKLEDANFLSILIMNAQKNWHCK